MTTEPQKVRLTRDLPADDPVNYFGHEMAAGAVLTVFRGATYGAVSFRQGIAVTESDDPWEGPFAQLNHADLEVIPTEDRREVDQTEPHRAEWLQEWGAAVRNGEEPPPEPDSDTPRP